MLTLFRYPLGFSLSPLVHQAFGQQIGLEISYTQTAVPEEGLRKAIDSFRKNGGIGANVTMPLKEAAFQRCVRVSKRAQMAQSVNTLYWQENVLCGDNTDGIGFYRDLTQNLQYQLKEKNICILGAGGAVRGIVADIAAQSPKRIIICNRTKTRAQALAEHFKQYKIDLEILSTEELNRICSYQDWVINARPSIIEEDLNPKVIEGSRIYNLTYAKDNKPLPFNVWASAHGAIKTYDGLGMLVEQAAESFQSWFGPSKLMTQPVISMLKAHLADLCF